MASTLPRNKDRLPPPATAFPIERRVPGHQAAVAGIFSFEEGIMKDKFGRRRTVPALVVALLYVALVLGAPLIVRYAPQPEVASAVVHTSLPAR
jgi:hypothetical protein